MDQIRGRLGGKELTAASALSMGRVGLFPDDGGVRNFELMSAVTGRCREKRVLTDPSAPSH